MFSRAMGAVGIVLAVAVLVGWSIESQVLTSLHPSLPSMKPNAAIAFGLLGIGLVLLHVTERVRWLRWVAEILGWMVALIGALTLAQYLLASDFGIDELLFDDVASAIGTSHPGRMAPYTAAVLILYGAAMALIQRKGAEWFAQLLGGLGLLIALLSMLGYLYGVIELRGPQRFTQMALPTTAAAFALGLGIVLARPRLGPIAVIAAETTGGIAARVLLPAAVIVPIAIGWLRLLGEHRNLYDVEFGAALFAIANVVVFVVLVLLSARSLHRVSLSRRQAESESRQFKFISDHARDEHFLIDRNGALRYVNDVACSELGYSRDELRELTVTAIHQDPVYARKHVERFFEVKADEPWAPIESVHRRKDGSTFPVSVSMTRVLLDGEPFLYAVARNISDLKAVQDELREQNHVLETINGVNTLLAAELDLEKLVQTVTDAGTELVNAEFGAFFYNVMNDRGEAYMLYTLSGAPKEAFEKYPMPRNTQVFHPTFAGEGIVRSDDITADPRYGQNPPYEGMPEGHVPVHSYLAAPVVSRSGEVIGGLFFGHKEKGVFDAHAEHVIKAVADQAAIAIEKARLFASAQNELAERRRAEEQLHELNETLEHRVQQRTAELKRTNERLENEVTERRRAERTLEKLNTALRQSNRELQEFAYAASHDLQEPLRKISSFADLLLTEYGPDMDGPAQEYVERMQHSALRMSRLIQDLLTFSQVSTQARPYERVDLTSLVEQVLDDLSVTVEESGSEIVVEPLPAIDADGTQMRQLFQNLISNAIKFRADSRPPVIRISGEKVLNDGVDMLSLRVRDNGIGFDEKYADKVFSPFQRLHGSDRYPGTGIGLAICRRIVERHRGSIRVKSSPGEGTTFIIELPIEQDLSKDPVATTRLESNGRTGS